jgi:hypothetical protein
MSMVTRLAALLKEATQIADDEETATDEVIASWLIERGVSLSEPAVPVPGGSGPTDHFYGKDCPVGMVQVEFVGVLPTLRYSDYGWKPSESAFLELWVDGQRFRVDVGNVLQSDGSVRRGLHIVGPFNLEVSHHSVNALDVLVPVSEVAHA